MSGHTPGPWYPIRNSAGYWEVMTVRDHDFMTGDPQSFVGYANGASICSGVGDHTESRTRGNEYENARLIAAAPDLLEALTMLWREYKSLADSGDAGQWSAEDTPEGIVALAAIARATQPLPTMSEE